MVNPTTSHHTQQTPTNQPLLTNNQRPQLSTMPVMSTTAPPPPTQKCLKTHQMPCLLQPIDVRPQHLLDILFGWETTEPRHTGVGKALPACPSQIKGEGGQWGSGEWREVVGAGATNGSQRGWVSPNLSLSPEGRVAVPSGATHTLSSRSRSTCSGSA